MPPIFSVMWPIALWLSALRLNPLRLDALLLNALWFHDRIRLRLMDAAIHPTACPDSGFGQQDGDLRATIGSVPLDFSGSSIGHPGMYCVASATPHWPWRTALVLGTL